MHVAGRVSMALQTSRAWVPHLHRAKANRARGQIYSWVEQQASSGLHPNTARAGRNQESKCTCCGTKNQQSAREELYLSLSLLQRYIRLCMTCKTLIHKVFDHDHILGLQSVGVVI